MAIKANKTYFIKRYSSSAYLNVYGNSYTGDMQPIKLWTKVETDPMQKWQFDAEPTTGAYLCTMCDLTRAINLYSVNTPNCTLWAKAGNATDGLVKIQEYASGVYYIYLPNRNLYLTANNTSNGTQVTWTSKVSPASVTQLWQFEEEESLKVDSSVPSSIVNKTCFIKNKATGRNLNVNGYDTVANSTNVNTYRREDCLAQRWVAKDTENGPKIFTKIDEDYALNIYNGNCTMYEAEGNDRDSLVIFTTQNAAEKTFRIKMYHHDKYLRAEGSFNGANVAWSDTNDDYALWQFVDEDDMFPPADPTPSAIKGQEFYLRAGDSACYLNVHGTDTVAVGRNVNVYSKDKCKAQCWIPDDHYGKPRLFTKINKAFGLNVYSDTNTNCTMYTVESNDVDSVLQFEYVATKQYRIKMLYHNKYLAVEGEITSGANVVWVDGASAATIWTFETETEAFIPAPAAPTAIVDKTCFVRADGTVYYLNVHGSDTVANTRNVDIFTAENCRAQRWIARGIEKDPKLHTAIDETFALNIYKDDCTMYTAAGNDMDSILEFVHVSGMKYKIKMFHHNKYLAIDGTPSIGADVIWVDTATAANIWEFIPEENMDLPEGAVPNAFTADSSLVTTVVPAHTNNFTPNRSANGSPISEICIHHAAGNITVATLGALWQNPNRAGSSHYGVNGTQIGQYVKESDIAWTNGHWESNKRSVTIETANSSSAPDWLVSDETLNTLIALVADIARRNNLGKLVVGENLTYHSMYSATLCPGPYLKSRLYTIAVEANKINSYIETVQQNLLNKTFYIQDYNNKKYINIDSSGGAARSSSNILILDNAGDKNSQRWTIVPTANGLKMVSGFNTKTTLIANDDNSCDFISNSEDSDDEDMDIVPYTDDTIGYSDNLFQIKLKNRNLFLAAIGSSLSWVSAFTTACLWKFKSKDEVIPEIIEDQKEAFKNKVIDTFNIPENEIIYSSINNCSFTTKSILIPTGSGSIEATYELSATRLSVNNPLPGIYVDYSSDGNGVYTTISDVLGVDNALIKVDLEGKDDAYSLLASVGASFPGGTIYLGYKPSILVPTRATFELLYTVDLTPDSKDIESEMSFKASFTITENLPPASPVTPSFVPIENIDPTLAFSGIAIFAIVLLGLATQTASIPAAVLLTILFLDEPSVNGILSSSNIETSPDE